MRRSVGPELKRRAVCPEAILGKASRNWKRKKKEKKKNPGRIGRAKSRRILGV